MVYAIMVILALLPAILIGGAAVAVRLALGPRAPALQVALWVSGVVAVAYAGWQVVEFYRDTSHRNVAVGSVVFIALPLFASAVALLAFGYAWGVGALVVEAVRLSKASTGVPAATVRCVVPLGAMAVAVYFTGVVLRPSASDRVQRARSADELMPLFERATRTSDADILQSLANSPLLPAEKLTELADHPDRWVRSRVAFNRRTPAQTLLRLADDPVPEVRQSLVGNEAVGDEVLEHLAARDDDGGRAACDALRVRRATTHASTTRPTVTQPASPPASSPP